MAEGDPTRYDREADNNGTATPWGAPEGWLFDQVNDTVRQLMASVRVNYDGSLRLADAGMNPGDQAGTMALQNADAVNIEGGTIAEGVVLGAVPIGVPVPLLTTLVSATFSAGRPVIDGVTYGNFYLCDGSTYTVPSGFLAGPVTVPDLRGRALFGAGVSGVIEGDEGGSLAPLTTSEGGSHTHHVPATDDPPRQGSGDNSLAQIDHTHTTEAAGEHSHTVTPVLPPLFGVDWIVRLY